MATDGELPAPDFTGRYFKFPRSVHEALRSNPIAHLVYSELLARAAYQAGPRMISGRVVTLAVGQCVAGRPELATSLSTSEQTIRTALNHLQTLQLITIESTKRGSVITLRGYAESLPGAPSGQPTDQPTDHQPGNQPATSQSTNRSTTNGDLRSETRDLRQGVGEPARAPARSQAPEPAPDQAPTPTRFPDGWSPDPESEANREAEAKARDRGVDVDQQLEALRNKAPAKGMTSLDWNATWRWWLSIADAARPGHAKRDEEPVRKIKTLAGPDRVRPVVPDDVVPEPDVEERLKWTAAVRDGLAYKPTPTPPADAPADTGTDG